MRLRVPPLGADAGAHVLGVSGFRGRGEADEVA